MNRQGTNSGLYKRIRQILESARTSAARSVNSAQVVSNWLTGREIVEDEQRGKRKAKYGEKVLSDLSAKLLRDFGRGYSATNLRLCRQFFLSFPILLCRSIHHTVCDELTNPKDGTPIAIASLPSEIRHTVCDESWEPGHLHPNLSWSLYRHLIRVEASDARSFYEIEAIKNNWSARELERQINSLLFERLAKSKDKAGVIRLAKRGQEVQQARDIFKDPLVIEFLGLPESPRLVESDLENRLISNLQNFLLELGKGFAFVARQQRLTLDGDHFYVDLVFYHVILKCYVLIDLKVGKLTHDDLGQIQLYVNYFDCERRTKGDNPTLGLVPCTDKNDAVVQYTLGENLKKQIFASRYKLHLATEKELRDEIRREVKILRANP